MISLDYPITQARVVPFTVKRASNNKLSTQPVSVSQSSPQRARLITAVIKIASILFSSAVSVYNWAKQGLYNLVAPARIQPIASPPLSPENKEFFRRSRGQTRIDLKTTASEEDLELTPSDKLLTTSNIIQWGLIGASYGGAPLNLIMPLSVLSSLGSEIASFYLLPKDASWLRKAMSIPLLSKAIIHYNPWIAKIFQAVSLFNLVQFSAMKLSNAWNKLYSSPKKAVGAGMTHLFNLVSNLTFTAGVVKLPMQKTCPPVAKVNLPCNGCGMFSVQHYLLGIFDRLEKGQYSGIKVDFGKTGPYYEEARGDNWFHYYFPSIDKTNSECPSAPEISFTGSEYGEIVSGVEGTYGHDNSALSPERAKFLVEKYLVLRPEIQNEIDSFIKTHFAESDHVIGVHYRGTDKACNSHFCEARRVPYQEMEASIRGYISDNKLENQKNVKILAISDEEPFIGYIKKEFPGQVISSPARRSTDGKPIHLGSNEPYQSGKEALIDASLLAKLSNVLIRTSSNLSKIAALLLRNGSKEIQVSKRFYQDPGYIKT